jgi:hypothetical protein
LHPVASLADFKGVRIAVEAVAENVEVKLRLFRDHDDATPPDAILASNTSSISITLIAAATKRIGMEISKFPAILQDRWVSVLHRFAPRLGGSLLSPFAKRSKPPSPPPRSLLGPAAVLISRWAAQA